MYIHICIYIYIHVYIYTYMYIYPPQGIRMKGAQVLHNVVQYDRMQGSFDRM